MEIAISSWQISMLELRICPGCGILADNVFVMNSFLVLFDLFMMYLVSKGPFGLWDSVLDSIPILLLVSSKVWN